MAKENIAFMVNLRKNTVPDSDMFGRYYPEAESKETLSTKGFAKHVSDHGGTLVSYELMQMVLAGIVKCLKEYMSQGQPVKLDGLGTFRPTVTSVTGGAASIEEALQKGVNNMVAGVNFVEGHRRQGEVVHPSHSALSLGHCAVRRRGHWRGRWYFSERWNQWQRLFAER